MSIQTRPRVAKSRRGLASVLLGALAFAAGSFAMQAQTALPSNILATTAPLDAPAGIAYDAAGNIYIADLNHNVIREVNLADVITTVAGTGEQGFAGDGGAPTGALLDSPAGVAVDGVGNIYIADTHNNRIRKVSGGIISTIAGTGVASFSGDGGAALSATLNHPTALAVDGAGNLYIADTDNHRIRKISGTNITTVAGDGEQSFAGDGGAATAAGLDSPNVVAVDGAGNIYIGDTHNERVRVVNSSGVISTLAGNSSKSYSGDGGAATSASLARPRGLSVDAAGNVYVADSDNNRIRLIATTGKIATAAGNGSQGFGGDGGPAISATLDTPRAPAVEVAGVFALSDTRNDLVRKVGLDGTIQTIAGVSQGTGGGQGTGGETLTLNGASTVAYNSGTLTAIFSNAAFIATGQVSLLDLTNGSTVVASVPWNNNVATIDTSALSGGTHQLIASYSGDSQNPAITSSVFMLTVTPLPVMAAATGVSIKYGQTVPALTGSLTGVLPQDTNKVTAVFATTATTTSPVGQYPITVTLAGTAATDYSVTLGAGSGDVVIGPAGSTTALSSSNTAPFLGAPVTLTALASSTTTGTPTGSMAFFDGTTLLATVPVTANGSATYSSSGFALGTHSITAVYSGDTNFTSSTSSATVETVTVVPNFTLTATGGATQTVNPGQTASYNFAVQSQNGGVTAPITLTSSGLPAGATVVFTPATVTLNNGTASFGLAIKTAALTAAKTPPSSPMRSPLLPISAAVFLLPLFRNKRIRARLAKMPRTLLTAFFVLIAGAATLGLTGCGSGGFFAQSQQTYTITVTATTTSAVNTTLQHTTTVTLIVQ
jgi:sugar lactone lactonase YvrE